MTGLLIIEALSFAAAALTHFGIIPLGLDDTSAGTAESIIAVVLLVGAVVTRVRPVWTRPAAVATQAFALAGTLIGLYLFIRLRPDKVVDIVYHLIMVVVLIAGVVIALRTNDRTRR